jgi:MacB-like periplasmic core domain
MMKPQEGQMIKRQLMLNVLLATIVVPVPSAEAQRYCNSPVPDFHNRSEVSLFVSGISTSTGNFTLSSVSHVNYHEMQNHFFPALFAGFRVIDAGVLHEGAAERTLRVQFVTGSYFQVLDVTAQMGRVINPDEDVPEDDLAIAVISDQLWMSMFQLDPDVVGRTIKVNDRRVKIVGVAPPGFHGVLQPAEETLWLPGASMPGARNRDSSEGYTHFVVTLGDGVTWQEARRHFEKLPAQLANAFPDVNQKFKTVSFSDLGLLSCPSQ